MVILEIYKVSISRIPKMLVRNDVIHILNPAKFCQCWVKIQVTSIVWHLEVCKIPFRTDRWQTIDGREPSSTVWRINIHTYIFSESRLWQHTRYYEWIYIIFSDIAAGLGVDSRGTLLYTQHGDHLGALVSDGAGV